MATEALIIFAATTPLVLGSTIASLAVLALAVRVGWESGDVVGRRLTPSSGDRRVLRNVAAAVLPAGVIAVWLLPIWVVISALILLALPIVTRPHTAGSVAETRPSHRGTLLVRGLPGIAAFPGLPLIAFAFAAAHTAWHPALLIAFVMVEVFDSFAVLGGRLYGKHQVFPRLSARKTVEGMLTGLAALCVFSLVVNLMILRLPVIVCVSLALGIAVAALAGDLLASAIKRPRK